MENVDDKNPSLYSHSKRLKNDFMCLTDILQDLENSGPCTILCFNRINIPREDVLPLLLKVVFLSLSCEEILAVSVCLEKKGNSYWV